MTTAKKPSIWLRFALWLLCAALAATVMLWLPIPAWLQLGLAVVASLILPVCDTRRLIARERAIARKSLQDVLNAIPHPLFIKRVDGRYIYVNNALAGEHDCTTDELVARSETNRNPAAGDRDTMKIEDHAVLSGRTINKEERVYHAVTGSLVDRRVTKAACANMDGGPAIVVSYLDLTALRNAERAANEAVKREADLRQRSEAFTQRLIDVIPAPVYVKNEHSHYIIVNDAFLTERGLKRDEITLNSTIESALNTRIRDEILAEDAKVLAGEPVYKEDHRKYDDGREKIRIISKGTCLGVDGRPVIVGANFDITPLRKAETELRGLLEHARAARQHTWDFMQRLLDLIPIAIYVKDSQSRYLIVNQTHLNERQVEAHHLIGKLPHELSFGRPWANMILAEDARVLAGEEIHKEECVAHDMTGDPVHRIVAKGSCLDDDGSPVILVAYIDITDLRQAERLAQKAKLIADTANHAKSLFLASMSHEIRTPISGVIGTLRLAMREKALQGYAEELVSTALLNAQSLLAIINDILDFSKIEAGELTLEHIDFDLRALIRHSMSAFRDHLADRSLRFVVDIDPNLPPYYRGDPTRLRQILINLVGNAIKFTQEGQITLSAVRDPNDTENYRIRFRIEDSGIGIPESAIERLFQKFQQADVSTTRKYGGTGLGLAICKQLVERMGGKISVSSTEGVGTTFEFTIPFAIGVAPVLVEATELPDHSHRLRVLCAEDYPANQLIARALLESMGHIVDIVDNGRKAVAQLCKNEYDLVLMDSRMPDMDGLEASQAIRQGGLDGLRVLDPNISIIALTANASESDRQACLDAGMNDYLTKPIDEQQLQQKLAQIINQRLAQGVALVPNPNAAGAQGNLAPERENPAPAKDAPAPTASPTRKLSGRLHKLFFDGLPQTLNGLDEAVVSLDYAQLARQAHGLKGSIGHFGGAHIESIAAALEDACDHGDSQRVLALHAQLRESLEALLQNHEAQKAQ